MTLMSRKDAAKYLGLSVGTLANWAVKNTNGLRYVKVGRSVKYRQSDLDDFIHTRTVGDATPQTMTPEGKWVAKIKEKIADPKRSERQWREFMSERDQVFQFWKDTFGQQEAVLDQNRASLIVSALKLNYSVEDLCNAIKGCSFSQWHMGRNEDGQVHNGLHIILRDAAQIDKFIGYAFDPPRILRKIDIQTRENFNEGLLWQQQKGKKRNERQ